MLVKVKTDQLKYFGNTDLIEAPATI